MSTENSKLYIHPLNYRDLSKGNSVCVPRCNICCYPVGNGISLSRQDILGNREYNIIAGQNGGIKVHIDSSRHPAQIPAIAVPNNELGDIVRLMELIGWGGIYIDGKLTRCVHINSPNGNISKLVENYNRILRMYGHDEVTPKDLENLDLGNLRVCEVHEAPRSSQCRRECTYSAAHFPKTLEEFGKSFLLELLRTDSLLERYILINLKLREIRRGEGKKKENNLV